MQTLLGLIAALSLTAPPDLHPLNDSQLTRLATATDQSPTIDEAALYALLENAAQWSEKETGAVVPDYDMIRRSPEDWRGQRCLIEGTVYRVLRPELSRSGWERAEGVVIRVAHGQEPPRAQDFVIVYLTDPPAWDWWKEDEGLPREHGRNVRVVARFYKTSAFFTQKKKEAGDGERNYLTFVGRSLSRIEEPAAPSSRMNVQFPLLLAMFILAVAFVVWRLKSMSRAEATTKLHDYLQQKRQERQTEEPEDETPEVPEELPPNPIEALDRLAGKRDPTRQAGDEKAEA